VLHVVGVVQIESLFYDTPNGFMKEKLYREPFPVIVMEMLSGGDILRRLVNRVIANQIPTEVEIARLFRGVIVALQSIHERSYIHRDLKYNNILLVSDRDDSTIKIIDFGCMTKVPEGDGSCIRDELIGTPGFYAPESISRSEYSFKTDIWQLGCVLYWSDPLLPSFLPSYLSASLPPYLCHI
jgi:serine/threonine protein kinase